MTIHCKCPARKGVQVTAKSPRTMRLAQAGEKAKEINPINGIPQGQESPFRVSTYQVSRAQNSLAMQLHNPRLSCCIMIRNVQPYASPRQESVFDTPADVRTRE